LSSELLTPLAQYVPGPKGVYATVQCLSVCQSVCPTVCHTCLLLQQHVAGLLLWAQQAGDIDRFLHGRCSAANAVSGCQLWV